MKYDGIFMDTFCPKDENFSRHKTKKQLKKMLVLLSEERKVVLSHHKTFEHVEKMRAIVNESIEMASKQ